MSPAAHAQLARSRRPSAPPVEVVRHAAAARRVRVSVPGLLKSAPHAQRIEQHLRARPGVEHVHADPNTGRVLILYGKPEALADQLRALQEALAQVPAPAETAEVAAAPPPAPKPPAPKPPAPGEEAWHALSVAQVFQRTGSGEAGLTPQEAVRRLAQHGPNLVEPLPERSPLRILIDQLNNLPTVLLVGSAGVALLMGNFLEAGAIAVVVMANAAIGYAIERRQESLLAHWQRLEAGVTSVVRDGTLMTVPASDLVPGDLLACRAGDVVPADARVIEAHRLACDEASLTGESEPRDKRPEPVPHGAPLADQACLLHAGTSVVKGHGRAIVLATGAATQMAHVRNLVETSASPPTPLERQLAGIGRRASAVSLGAAGVAACAGLLHGRPAFMMIRNAVALAVAAIPEGLPLVATATLMRTMRRMRSEGMIVRRVASAEALGSVTVLCIDKTGTLTENEMCVESLELEAGSVRADALQARPDAILEDPATLALAVGILNSDIAYHNGNGSEPGALSGSSTERALVRAAQSAGLDPQELRRRYPRRALHERDEGRQYTLSLHRVAGDESGGLALVKGAPEQVLALCTQTMDGSPLEQGGRDRWLARNEQLAADGLRVLALGWRRTSAESEATDADEPLRFVGLVALRDPLRVGAAAAIQAARKAGIRPLMLTGDQRTTAAAIAAQVGLQGEVVEGAELVRALEAKDPAAAARLAQISVLSRVTPADKLAVVRALREQGEVVAMVGDGINDAPALKVADVGIAVGNRATNLTRHTADLVLEHEELSAILTAISEARLAQDNLRRSMRFLLATNLSEVALMVGGALFGAAPLGPLQLLWVNLLTDTMPALTLALAPRDASLMEGRGADGYDLLGRRSWGQIGRDAGLIAAAAATGFVLGGPDTAFATLIGAQLGYALQQRAPETTALGAGAAVSAAVGGSLALQLAALTVPALRGVLGLSGAVVPALLGTGVGFALPLLLGAARFHLARPPQAPLVLLGPLTN